MELLQLKYFLKTAELEHMSQAAKELYISQPALSKMIKNLENELNVKLFDRVGKKIVLNENGRIFQKHVKRALGALDNAVLELSDRANIQNNITVSFAAATRHLPQIVLGFKKENPSINIMINQAYPPDSDMSSDLYIYSSRLPAYGNSCLTLLSEECLLGLNTDHPLAERKVIDPRDLTNEKFIIMHRHLPLSDITEEICREGGFTPQISLECDNHEAVFSFIGMGMGVSVIPSKTWGPYYKVSKVTYRHLLFKPFRCINLCWNAGKYMTNSVIKFKDYLISYFSAL